MKLADSFLNISFRRPKLANNIRFMMLVGFVIGSVFLGISLLMGWGWLGLPFLANLPLLSSSAVVLLSTMGIAGALGCLPSMVHFLMNCCTSTAKRSSQSPVTSFASQCEAQELSPAPATTSVILNKLLKSKRSELTLPEVNTDDHKLSNGAAVSTRAIVLAEPTRLNIISSRFHQSTKLPNVIAKSTLNPFEHLGRPNGDTTALVDGSYRRGR